MQIYKMNVKTDFDKQFLISTRIHNSHNFIAAFWLNVEKKTCNSPTPVVKENH